MFRALVRVCALVLVSISVAGLSGAEDLQPIKLNPPDKTRGLPFMETVAVKASVREFAPTELSLQDLSDLLWAANGLNRPDENKTTASSAMNSHDVDLYVFTKDGAYVYDFQQHELTPQVAGDYREDIVRARPSQTEEEETVPPVIILLISDASRFRVGTDAQKLEWGAIDAGIISQNISLFCAATGLKTVPRASTDKDKATSILNLKDSQTIFLNHPIGHARE